MTFHDHMWKLPCSMRMTTYAVHATQSSRIGALLGALLGSHAENFIPKLGCHLFFPWVSRTKFSRQMALMRFQASPTSLWGGHPHPHQQGPPSKEACFPSSVSSFCFPSSVSSSTRSMVLLASRAAARACQCWRLRPEKPTQAEGDPQAISNDQSLGCWRLVRTPTFMPIYFGLRTHHGYKLWNHLQ